MVLTLLDFFSLFVSHFKFATQRFVLVLSQIMFLSIVSIKVHGFFLSIFLVCQKEIFFGFVNIGFFSCFVKINVFSVCKSLNFEVLSQIYIFWCRTNYSKYFFGDKFFCEKFFFWEKVYVAKKN